MKTNSQKDVVAMALTNAAGAIDTARDYLDKLCAAHLLMAGAWDPGDAVFDAAEDARIQAFGTNAAEVAAHLQCLENYFAEIREAVGITKRLAVEAVANDHAHAAEE